MAGAHCGRPGVSVRTLHDYKTKRRVLMPAMIANVHLIYAEAKGMVAVPAAALGAVAADGWRSLRVLGPERAAAERRF